MKRMAWVPLKGCPRITQSRIIILTYPWLYKSGHLLPTYPGICKSRYLIPTYPGLSQWSLKPIQGYPGLSWLAKLPRVSLFQVLCIQHRLELNCFSLHDFCSMLISQVVDLRKVRTWNLELCSTQAEEHSEIFSLRTLVFPLYTHRATHQPQ